MSYPDFLFAVHNHQPVGDFDFVVKSAFHDCYGPLLDVLAGHPSFRFALHFSGPLWEYMEKHERGCWDLVRELAGRGQVEPLGGGFYEPVLTTIPEADRDGQLRLMNDFIGENFGQKPRGLWLTERVWEPHLPKSLAVLGGEEGHGPLAGNVTLATGIAWHEPHEWLACALLLLVVVHLIGVAVESILHRDNLVAAMISGKKSLHDSPQVVPNYRWLAVIMLVAWLGAYNCRGAALAECR